MISFLFWFLEIFLIDFLSIWICLNGGNMLKCVLFCWFWGGNSLVWFLFCLATGATLGLPFQARPLFWKKPMIYQMTEILILGICLNRFLFIFGMFEIFVIDFLSTWILGWFVIDFFSIVISYNIQNLISFLFGILEIVSTYFFSIWTFGNRRNWFLFHLDFRKGS